MKVQLVVVQGKPEGKVIPLAIPIFRIGRGETCHLRPNSDQVSREHAELAVLADRVTVRDLGSRNGTIVNGKPASGVVTLKDGDLVQVGPLTFAVDIKGAPVAVAAAKPPSLDDVSNAEIDAWLVTDSAGVAPESPSGVYGGETITIESYKGLTPKPPPLGPVSKAKPEAEPEAEPEALVEQLSEEEADAKDDGIWKPDSEDDHDAGADAPEEFIDESNPFYAARKAAAAAAAEQPAKKNAPGADSSMAANDILRRMMERKRASK